VTSISAVAINFSFGNASSASGNDIPTLAMLFQLWQCYFNYGNAFSAVAINFNYGNAFSAVAMRFQLWQCDFDYDNAVSALAARFQQNK
jgi:hypothetical protein